MRGMELWRPDWEKIMGCQADPNANELITITRETASIAMCALAQQNREDAYNNVMAAERELFDALRFWRPPGSGRRG